ncbi:hypothetical protein [Schaalia suimastitidis]|uniref:hypothetical protein n=1 Tax=Schaalia suimastitidis TaxID=121163 RepID=UPI000554FF97|nr:hypothetical protein [Schaalia suimastitidis]
MEYAITSTDGHALVGNRNTTEYHVMTNETRNCQIPEIAQARHLVGFIPDTERQAQIEGYTPCYYCSR